MAWRRWLDPKFVRHPRDYRFKENNLTMLARESDKKSRMINDGQFTKKLYEMPCLVIRVSSIFFGGIMD